MNDIQTTDALIAIAEIAVALAGFAGLIVALRNQGVSAWSPNDVIRLRFMLVIACGTFFAALCPFLFVNLVRSASSTWFLSGITLGIGLGALFIWTMIGTRPIRHQLSRPWLLIYKIGTLLSALIVFLGVFEPFRLSALGAFYIGLLWLLFYSTTLFIRLILMPPGWSPEQNE